MDSARSPAPGAPLTRQQPQPPERHAARQTPPRPIGWALLPLRGYLAVVYLYAGISKIADTRFLDQSSPTSLHATLAAVRNASPIRSLLGPVADHTFAFGLLIAFAEIAVGIGIALGLLTRVAAFGGMVLALSLWLTVSWGAEPWYTSADLAYLFAFTPLLLAGAAACGRSTPGWTPKRPVGPTPARTASAGPSSSPAPRSSAECSRPGRRCFVARRALGPRGRQPPVPAPRRELRWRRRLRCRSVAASRSLIRSPGTRRGYLQLSAGQFTAYDAVCPHQGCPVMFVSGSNGFHCPCHGSTFAADGSLISGPATSGLHAVAIRVDGTEIRRA